MGRGRQKAKHAKIARQLKAYSPEVNYDALQRELTGASSDDVEDPYAQWEDKYAEPPLSDKSSEE